MTTVAEYVAANAKWMRDCERAQVERLTDADVPAVMAATAETGGGSDEIGHMVFSHETLADFDNSRMTSWSERGARYEVVCAGRPAVLYEGFQMVKGQTRVSAMCVVDLGDRRVAVR